MKSSSPTAGQQTEPTSPPAGGKTLHDGSFLSYRGYIQRHYDGLAGAFTSVTGLITGHEALAGKLIRPGVFDVRGRKHILDAGCGNGRYSKFLLRSADPDACLTGFDLSQNMLHRARARLKSERVTLASADLTRLPYPDGFFDAAVCGWVLEHLPDPRPGLLELARVLQPGGKLLLMVTEDNWSGKLCGWMWHCRTHNREQLKQVAHECGLNWIQPFFFSRLHRWLHLGGIIAEYQRST